MSVRGSKDIEDVKSGIRNISTKYPIEEVRKPYIDYMERRVYLFFSIDLTNSTKYKYRNKDWPDTFYKVFDAIKGYVNTNMKPLDIWKFRGDELVFYHEVNSISDVLDFAPTCFNALHNCKLLIQEIVDKDFNNELGLKGAIWIAAVQNSGSEHEHINNIFFDNNDFLGRDLDIGFRAAEYVEKDRLQVDVKIAYLVNKVFMERDGKYRQTHRKHISTHELYRIVAFRKLKGVWNDRAYPIVWYDNRWKVKNCQFKYDDYLNSDIVKELYSMKYEPIPIDIIDEIALDVGIKDEVEALEETILSNKGYNMKPRSSTIVELHVSVVCIDPNTDTIFLAKRNSDRRSYKNTWEFGCSRDVNNDDIVSLLKRRYKDYFNLNIDIILDKNGDSHKQPIPISVYTIYKDNKIYTGITFVGIITDESINIERKEHKHSNHTFFTLDEIRALNTEEYKLMPGLKSSAKKAIELYKREKKLNEK